MIVFETCNNKTSSQTCKSEAEIEEWFENKYIFTLFNQKKFQQHKFEDERIQRFSQIKWHPLTYNLRADYAYLITRGELQLNDKHFNIGGIFTEYESGF